MATPIRGGSCNKYTIGFNHTKVKLNIHTHCMTMTSILVTNTMLNHIKHSFHLATREIYTKIQMFRMGIQTKILDSNIKSKIKTKIQMFRMGSQIKILLIKKINFKSECIIISKCSGWEATIIGSKKANKI